MSKPLPFPMREDTKLLVASHWRGFHMITGSPSVTTSEMGSSSTHVVVEVSRLVWADDSWTMKPHPRLWMKAALDKAIALTGAEPWRVYELSARSVEESLRRGIHIDDIRGFKNRLEPWQPFVNLADLKRAHDLGTDAPRDLYASPAAAEVWGRVDGWKVERQVDLTWRGVPCEPDSCVGVSPNHFRTIHHDNGDEMIFETANAAMAAVDQHRRWE